MIKNILITGLPHSGKSTAINKIIADIAPKVGFITNEILLGDQRTGFEIVSSYGEKVVLASTDFKTTQKVSKYFVDIKNLDAILPNIAEFNPEDILYIDEIGQMELFSDSFKVLALKYLNSENICLATLSQVYDDDFMKKIKNRDDIFLVEITPDNREEKTEMIRAFIKKIIKAKKYIKEKERFDISGNVVKMKSTHGTRDIVYDRSGWRCDCEFFIKNKICSHVIALKEIIKQK